MELRDRVLQLRAANEIARGVAQSGLDVLLDVFLNVFLAYRSIGDRGPDRLHFHGLAGFWVLDHSRKFDLSEEVECGAGSQTKVEHVHPDDQVGGGLIGGQKIRSLERAL